MNTGAAVVAAVQSASNINSSSGGGGGGGISNSLFATTNGIANQCCSSTKMTCEDERLSTRWKKRRQRFMDAIDNAKSVAERTKVRQENARQELLKRERADMEKYHRRYLETALKQHLEQQAKSRENSVTQLCGQSLLLDSAQSHRKQPMISNGYSGYPHQAAAPSHSVANQVNSRKRSHQISDDWTQYANMVSAMFNPSNNFSTAEDGTKRYHQQIMNGGISGTVNPGTVLANNSNGTIASIAQSMNGNVNTFHGYGAKSGDEVANQYDQSRMGMSAMPTTSQQAFTVNTFEEGFSTLSAMPDLAESQVKSLINQLGEGSLNDLGDNCLEGVLINRTDYTELTNDTTLVNSPDDCNMISSSESIVSPHSLSSGTPHSSSIPAQIPAAMQQLPNHGQHHQQQQQHHQFAATNGAMTPMQSLQYCAAGNPGNFQNGNVSDNCNNLITVPPSGSCQYNNPGFSASEAPYSLIVPSTMDSQSQCMVAPQSMQPMRAPYMNGTRAHAPNDYARFDGYCDPQERANKAMYTRFAAPNTFVNSYPSLNYNHTAGYPHGISYNSPNDMYGQCQQNYQLFQMDPTQHRMNGLAFGSDSMRDATIYPLRNNSGYTMQSEKGVVPYPPMSFVNQ